MKKSAFTLAEVLITTVILWILSVILFRSYNTISDSLFRISNENLIVREWIFLLEVLENKVANAKIDFEWYDVKPVNNSWFTDRLILKRWDDKIEFLFSGNCNQKLSWTAEISMFIKNNRCYLVMIENDDVVEITDSKKVFLLDPEFRLMPYQPNNFTWTKPTDRFHEWFWIKTTIIPMNYGNLRSTQTTLPIQTFFNL